MAQCHITLMSVLKHWNSWQFVVLNVFERGLKLVRQLMLRTDISTLLYALDT